MRCTWPVGNEEARATSSAPAAIPVRCPARTSGRWFRAGETVRVDLANRRVDYGPGTAAAEVTGAEDVTAIATRVRIMGDHRDNADHGRRLRRTSARG